ncbi:MAG TPA: hypothetical protein VIC85_10140 [Ktedonobacterales bacterium]|jgi:hypothetical protein
MRHLSWSGAVTAMLLITIAIAGCAMSPITGGATVNTPSVQETPSSGPVTVAVDRSQYTTADTIVVTINNTTGTTLYAAGERTQCTVVTLQWLSGDTWQQEYPCAMSVAAHSAPIAPGTSIVRLSPNQGGYGPWEAGVCRIVLAYGQHPGVPLNQNTLVYSGTFTVA